MPYASEILVAVNVNSQHCGRTVWHLLALMFFPHRNWLNVERPACWMLQFKMIQTWRCLQKNDLQLWQSLGLARSRSRSLRNLIRSTRPDHRGPIHTRISNHTHIYIYIFNIFNRFITYYPRYCMVFLICVDSSSQKRWMFHVTFEPGLDESRDWDVTGSSRKDSSDLSWSHGAGTAGRRFRSQRWLGEVKTQGTLVMMVMVQD